MSLFSRKKAQDFARLQQEVEAVTAKIRSMHAHRCSLELKAKDYVYLGQLVEAFQEYCRKNDQSMGEFVASVNEIFADAVVDDMIDNIKAGVGDAQGISNQVNSISQAIGEQTAAAEATADGTESIALSFELTTKNAQKGRESLGQVFEQFEVVSEKVSQLVRQIEELKNDIQSTSQVVDFIREVSEQTNLLALNAAIEAARAGEQGRGFAVVAEEVRKLAEKTRESIDTISDTVASIQRQIQVSVAESEPILAEVARSREMAREAEGLFSIIVEEVVKSSEQIQDLTAASQELSASMEEVSAGSEEIAKLARHSEVTFTETGRGIYGFTQSMEKLRQALAGFQVQLGDEQMLSIAKMDHLLWKWKLYSMLFGYESINVEAVASHKTCRLGQWYLASWERFGHLGSFQRLDEPHEKMHQITRRSVELYQEGRLVEAEQLVEEVKILSSAILGILDEIAQDIRRNQEGI